MSSEVYGAFADRLEFDWPSIARPEQRMPVDDDWTVWLYLAGRGAGKTRSGAEGVREWIETGRCRRVALIAPTAADARDVMIEGASGILAVCPPSNRPTFEPSKRRLTWPSSSGPSSGAIATVYSAEEADRLRGPQHDGLWADELAAWPAKDAQTVWDMAMFGLRVGRRPRAIVTTTPRPVKLLRDLLKRDGQDVRVTRGSTYDNRENLAGSFLNTIVRRYEGTRLGRQELMAEMLEDVENSLWSWAQIEIARKPCFVADMTRVVVALDASGARGADDAGADSIGIVVAGRGSDGRAYVLADRTCKLSPAGWGRRAVDAYHEFSADRLVGERNYGGAMIEHVIRTVDRNVAYREVTASRGKVQRAEPVAALYEQGKVSHVAELSALESQLCAMTSEGFQGDGSPDRADALVWALTDLMITPQRPQLVFG
jgi:phage terminase large subunit-like protein